MLRTPSLHYESSQNFERLSYSKSYRRPMFSAVAIARAGAASGWGSAAKHAGRSRHRPPPGLRKCRHKMYGGIPKFQRRPLADHFGNSGTANESPKGWRTFILFLKFPAFLEISVFCTNCIFASFLLYLLLHSLCENVH